MKKTTGTLSVLIGACAVPTLAGAFGLGEAEVRSDIGQPLNITIPITLERSEALSRLRVELASPASYVDAGLEWPQVLNRAVVTIEQGRDGSPFVRIRSEERVMEPILPLLVEARLGSVSLHRDYSAFLDLPTSLTRVQIARPVMPPDRGSLETRPFEAAPKNTTPAPGTATTTAMAATAAPAADAPAASAPAPSRVTTPASSAAAPRASRGTPIIAAGRTTVAPNESLGELAQRVRTDPSIPLRRMMAAVYAANPDAFHGSIDRMWAGAEILVPPADHVRELARTVDLGSGARHSRAPDLRFEPQSVPAYALSPTLGSGWSPSRPTLKVIGDLGSLPGFSRTIARTLQLAETLATPPSADEMAAVTSRLATAQTSVASPVAETAAAPAESLAAAPVESPAAAPATVAAPASSSRGFFFYAFLGLLGWIVARYADRTWKLKDRIAAAIDRRRAAAPEAQDTPPAAPPARTLWPAEVSAPMPRAAERLMSVTPAPVLATEPAPAAAPELAPTAATGPTPKIVSIKRRAEHAIEVTEAPHDATHANGGLNGFYADVAQMLATALEHDPRRRDLRLKLLEVYFSAGLADEYLTQTRAYLDELRGQNDESWAEVAQMGRQLAPGHEWFSLDKPPRLPAPGSAGAAATNVAPKRNFNRYYEGVDQWRLRGALEELAQQYKLLVRDPSFTTMQSDLLQKLAGRPTLLIHASALSQKLGGAQIYLKREPRHGSGDDHLINAIGQAALARRMNRRGVVAATSNGLHGLAVAAVAKSLGLECTVFMEDRDVRAHYPRVLRMREFGARVEEVHQNASMPGELDVRRSALNAWLERPKETLYISSLSSGPHPYPMIMQDCQAVVGRETRHQLQLHSQRPPAAIVAGTADGPGVIGLLHSFLDETQTRLHCVESSLTGRLLDRVTLRNEGPDLEMTEHNWPREHNWLKESRRVTYGKVPEPEVILAMQLAYETEKLMLSQEGAHVVAYAARVARELRPDQTIVLLLPSQNDADAKLMENASSRQIRMDVM